VTGRRGAAGTNVHPDGLADPDAHVDSSTGQHPDPRSRRLLRAHQRGNLRRLLRRVRNDDQAVDDVTRAANEFSGE